MGMFADNFRLLLRQRGLKQIDAARQLGVTQPTICRWLSGEHEPSFAALMRVASRLNTPVEGFRESKRAGKPIVKEARAPYGASRPPTEPLESLKRRWKHAKSAERKAIEVDLARLFPGHQLALLAWLNAP